MCSVCLSTPCRSGCPNEHDPAPVYTCSQCGYGIYDGDKYLDTSKGYVCEGCLEDMTLGNLLGLFGESLATA